MGSLEDNLFFNTLTSSFRKRYQEVIDNCYHLCIPVNGSYNPRQLNDKFITSHILKPSPLLKSHFLPYNNKLNFHVQIDGKYVKVTKGFGDQNHTSIRILNEEKAYNNSNKKYSIIICEQPLISSLNCKLNYETTNSTSHDIELVSFKDCEDFLRKISSCELEKLTFKINELIRTYIILPDYLKDVALRLKRIIDLSITSFTNDYNKNAQYRNNKELLNSMVESYSIGLIYDKLITPIRKKLAKEDEAFVRKTREVKRCNLSPVHFGAQKAFEKFTIPKELVSQFMEVDSQITPLSKLNSMRQTLDAINEQLKRTVDEHKSPFANQNDKVYIMSDDLIAAVICVLAQCEPIHFCSDIEFIHSFSWYLPQNSELGYSSVTFEVAKEYIVNYSTGSQQQENEPDTCNQPAFRGAPKSQHSPASSSSEFSCFDREIDRITQILGNSDLECDANRNSTTGQPTASEELGGFLGSLAGDCLTTSGQKF